MWLGGFLTLFCPVLQEGSATAFLEYTAFYRKVDAVVIRLALACFEHIRVISMVGFIHIFLKHIKGRLSQIFPTDRLYIIPIQV